MRGGGTLGSFFVNNTKYTILIAEGSLVLQDKSNSNKLLQAII